MALNFELVASDQLFSVVLASCKWFKISAPGVRMRHMWQLESLENPKYKKNLVKSWSGHHEKNVGLQMVFQNDHSVIWRDFHNFGFEKMMYIHKLFKSYDFAVRFFFRDGINCCKANFAKIFPTLDKLHFTTLHTHLFRYIIHFFNILAIILFVYSVSR